MRRGLVILFCATLCGFLAVGGTARAQATDRCQAGRDQWAGQAFANAISEYSLEWSPFGTTEWGWVTYLPLLQNELGTDCDANTPAFAAALAAFQTRHALTPTGIFDQPTFLTLKGVLQERRPFVMARVRDECPDPPPIRELGYLVESEEHADRLTRLLRRDVLDAYRRMVVAARVEVPQVRNDPERLQIFSGFRDPEADAARCAAERNCDGLRRAVCSPHRTGTAVDLYVGELLGMGVDSTNPASRLHMTQEPTYRWLVRNAGRFGFVPYIFEPWHWEYVGPTTSDGTP